MLPQILLDVTDQRDGYKEKEGSMQLVITSDMLVPLFHCCWDPLRAGVCSK